MNVPRTITKVFDFEEEQFPLVLSPEVELLPETGLRLIRQEGGEFHRRGTVTSRRERSPFPFNDVVLSWNLDLPEGTGALVEVRAFNEKDEPTAWYEVARFGNTPIPLERVKKDDFGCVDEDTMILNDFRQEVEYRVTLFTGLPHRAPTLRLMAICFSDMKNKLPLEIPPVPAEKQPWMRSLPVPWRSQFAEEQSIRWRICGPTSLSMAMEYHGVKLSTPEAGAQAWDEFGWMFGNWPFIAQAAARNGFKSWVARCDGFEQMKEEIAAGRPAIFGVAYAEGELTNPPVPRSGGHLLLCVGFTPDGDLICNDPGNLDPSFDHCVYKKEELAKVWLGKGDIIIRVVPRNKK